MTLLRRMSSDDLVKFVESTLSLHIRAKMFSLFHAGEADTFAHKTGEADTHKEHRSLVYYICNIPLCA